MLELRPSCECCDRYLAPDARNAMICSFECTFCASCVDERLHGVCPNCGGEFVRRPIRPPTKLLKNPPGTRRVLAPSGCSPSN
jgi:uncharacterized protein